MRPDGRPSRAVRKSSSDTGRTAHFRAVAAQRGALTPDVRPVAPASVGCPIWPAIDHARPCECHATTTHVTAAVEGVCWHHPRPENPADHPTIMERAVEGKRNSIATARGLGTPSPATRRHCRFCYHARPAQLVMGMANLPPAQPLRNPMRPGCASPFASRCASVGRKASLWGLCSF